VLVLSGVVCAAEHTTDTLETVKKNVKDGNALGVGVREIDGWKDGHLKDAKHIALSDLKKGIPADELKKTLPAGSVVYCTCPADHVIDG